MNKILLFLMVLIPSLSWGEQILKCNIKDYEELFGDHYYSLESNQISYVPKDGTSKSAIWKLDEENKVFAKFVIRSLVDNSLITQLVLNKISLEMEYTLHYSDGSDSKIEQLVCSRM